MDASNGRRQAKIGMDPKQVGRLAKIVGLSLYLHVVFAPDRSRRRIRRSRIALARTKPSTFLNRDATRFDCGVKRFDKG